MLHAVVRSSLRFRGLVIALAAGLMIFGTLRLRDAPVDVLPEFTPPYVEIQTEALGLSADEVEQLITVPLEADLLNGVEGVETIRSESLPSLSSIVLVFDRGTDVYRARQLVGERLTQAHALPNVSKPPTVLQPLSSSSRVLMIGLSSKQISPIEKSVIARWTVRPRLMGVPGVANVAIWGMRDQELQVQVDPERLRDRKVTLGQVIKTAGNAQIVSPLSFLEASTPGTGGFIETPQQRLQVRNVLDRIANPRELGKVPVEDTASKLSLADVAEVKVDHQPLIGDAVVNGGEGLLLVVEKFPGADSLEVTRGVEDALAKLRPGLSGMQTDTSLLRPAAYIEEAMNNLSLAILVAGVLLALALGALFFAWRTALIALVTIPLSLVTAALVLDLLGQTFNAISFAGLAVAVAVVIDDAVVGVENVARRMHELRSTGADPSIRTTVLEASHEVRSPIMYATFIALLAVLPMVVMDGRPGAFFQPLALAYVTAVLAATAVALVVTPALSLLLFSRGDSVRAPSPLLRRARPRYEAALARLIRNPRAGFMLAAACFAIGLAVLPVLGTSLVPSFQDRDVVVELVGEPGTSSPKMTQTAAALSRQLRSIPGVESVGAHVGRAVTGDEVVDVNSSEVWVGLRADADHDATLASIDATAGRLPGVQAEVLTYSTRKMVDVGALDDGHNPVRSDDLDVLTGSDKPLLVRLYGQDLDVLRREAGKVRQVVSEVEGVVNPRIELPPQQPALEIEVDLAKARRHGIKPGDVRRAEATLLQGIQVGSVFQRQKVFDVVVQGVPETRRNVSDVRNLLIDKPGGGHVRLGQVAEVRVTPSPTVVQRDAVSRRVDITADIGGRGLGEVTGDVEARVAGLSFPLEYHAEVLHQTTGDEIHAPDMLAAALAAAMLAFLLLQAAFRSWRLAALAFLTLPVALAGGLVAALIDDAELSLGALLGLLALIAIAARQAVVLIRHLKRLERDNPEGSAPDLVRRGTLDRFAPALTTACALALVLLPFVALGTRPGLEVVHPMAVVILGGLVTSTLLNLFVLPALYLLVAAGHQGVAATEAQEEEDDLPFPWALAGDRSRPESASGDTGRDGPSTGGPGEPLPAGGSATGSKR